MLHEVKKNNYIKSDEVIEKRNKLIDLKNSFLKMGNRDVVESTRIAFTGGLSQREYNIIRILADEGNKAALYNLGVVYEKGLMGVIDIEKALELYIKAAEKGAILAIRKLLVSCNQGLHLDKTVVEHWLTVAIENEDPIVFRTLGDMYRVGRYMNKDVDTALVWYRKAANLGDIDSLAMIAHKNEWDMVETFEKNNEYNTIITRWKKQFI